jgi:ABC-type Fe3+-hydroxamate transport system substrate-binding protein
MRTLQDALGRVVQLPDAPQRLVSLVPSLTEVLFGFGWGPQVVGITTYCTEPATEVAGITTIGGTKNPHIATILALQPQLVFAVAEENRRQDVEALTAAGVAVYVFDPRTVRDGIDLLWRMADLLACRATVASQIQAVEQAYADTELLVAQRQRVRVFCPVWKDPYMTINEETYVHDMLRVCGADNIFAHRQRRFPLAADLGRQPQATGARYEARDRRYPRVTLEEMAALQPEVVLLPDEPYAFTEADKADFTPLTEVPAVRHGRIHLLDGKLVSWYGLRLAQSLPILRELCTLEPRP